MPCQTRRGLVQKLGLLIGAGTLPIPAWTAALTPRQTAGPFYPPELPLDDDNDLTRVQGRPKPADGQHTELTGRLLDRNGRPIAGRRIEIWQCDANGRYRHPRDPGSATPDPGFQGHGHTLSDAEGRYRFRTIRPVPYPGRTPHIHVAVLDGERRILVTQLYVAGEPRNQSDFLYQSLDEGERQHLTTHFSAGALGNAGQARWDIIVG